MKILGIDDAGRGPLIGPMILAGVLLEEEDEEKLDSLGVDDSKQLTQNVRVKLAKTIIDYAKNYKVVISTPQEIDKEVDGGMNLNTLEAKKAAQIINELNNGEKIKVVVDCPSINTKAWQKTMMDFVEKKDNLEVYCEHKADANHTSVSAASILAKVRREEEIDKLKINFGDFGSGYPSDPITKKFLKERGSELKDSGIFRKSWQTWKQMFKSPIVNDKKQSTLF
jgi:ribonuclease HII